MIHLLFFFPFITINMCLSLWITYFCFLLVYSTFFLPPLWGCIDLDKLIKWDIYIRSLSICDCLESRTSKSSYLLRHKHFYSLNIQIRSDQISCSVVSNSLRPHESQHARPPCPSPIHGVHSDSCPSSQWCHPAISSSVIPFSSCPNPSQHQSLFWRVSQKSEWVNSSQEVAKVLEFQL